MNYCISKNAALRSIKNASVKLNTIIVQIPGKMRTAHNQFFTRCLEDKGVKLLPRKIWAVLEKTMILYFSNYHQEITEMQNFLLSKLIENFATIV